MILTAQPDFSDLACAELYALVPHAQMKSILAPGVLLLDPPDAFDIAAETWRNAPPTFVRHVSPIQLTLPLQGDKSDIARLEQAIQKGIAPKMDAARSFSVQSRLLTEVGYKPFDVNGAVSKMIQAEVGSHLNVRNPQQILSIVCAQVISNKSNGDKFAYIGLSPVEDNLSDWAGGMRRFAREKGQLSRSEFKLLEALEVFDIVLPPRGIALDLGAAPGGWTRVLRQHEQYVTAVDTGLLHPSLTADSGVRHKRMTAEEYLDSPDEFDLIVNDMRMDARDSARLLVAYAPTLRPDGMVVMTLKLPEVQRRTALDHAMNILRQAYTIVGARQLFHNRSEITLYLNNG